MADTRKWAKIDLGYLTNPKMSDLLDTSSSAPLMHLASILHCAQHLTDGHVSAKAMQRAVGGSNDDTALLVTAGLWHEQGHECDECPQPEDGRIYVHNYLEHNVSSAKVERLSERGQKAARARWDNERTDATSMQDAPPEHATSNADGNATSMQRAMPEREEKKEREEGPKKRGPHPLPADFSLTEDMRTWALKVTPAVDPGRQTFDFIHYWTKGDGAGKRKADWPRTWQNNMKRKQEWAERDGWKPPPAPGKDMTDPMNW